MTLQQPHNHGEPETDHDNNNGDLTYMNKRVERRYDILTSAAMIIALASLITASASVYMLIDSRRNNDDRTAQIIAAMKQQPISVPGSAGTTNQSQTQASAMPSASVSPTSAAAQQGASATGQQVGGSASGQQQGNAAGQQQVGGSASAGGGGAAAAGGGAAAAGGGAQNAPQNQAQPVATAPVPSPELLLQTTMAAAEPGVPGSQLATKTVDGQVAGPTLERVAEVRAKMAPPPGMEHMGDVVNFQVHDVVVNNDTATATLVIVWPAGWGEWTYPNSGYQYVDGEWKLQKSTVCNLAAAAWVDCY